MSFASASQKAQLRTWTSQQLNRLSKQHINFDTVDTLLALTDDADIESSILMMLGATEPVLAFVRRLLQRRGKLRDASKPGRTVQSKLTESLEGVQVYRKGDDEDTFFYGGRSKANRSKGDPSKGAASNGGHPGKKSQRKKQQLQDASAQSNVTRIPCDCQALKHPLLGNCLNCGKIICEREGYGACMFCGKMYDPSIKSQVEATAEHDEALAAAIARKTALLEHDRYKSQRTQVYDDQADYFSTDSQWLPPDLRAKLQAEEESRRAAKSSRSFTFTLDLFGRKIVADESFKGSIYDPSGVREIMNEHAAASHAKHYQTTDDPSPAPDAPRTVVASSHGAMANPDLTVFAPHFEVERGDDDDKEVDEIRGRIMARKAQRAGGVWDRCKASTKPSKIQHEYFAEDLDDMMYMEDDSLISESDADAEDGSDDGDTGLGGLRSPGASLWALCGMVEEHGTGKGVWTWTDRNAALQLLVERGMNYYMYAPNADPLRCSALDQEYTKEALDAMSDFVGRCERQGVNFNYSIRLPSTFVFDEGAHRAAVVARVRQLKSVGCTNFTLFYDDTSLQLQPAEAQVHKSAARAHGCLVNAIVTECGGVSGAEVSVFMAPHQCFGVPGVGSLALKKYFNELPHVLKKGVGIVWRGPVGATTWTPFMDVPHVQSLRACFGAKRRIVLLDLYPNNDHIGQAAVTPLQAYRGRDPMLYKHATGLLLTPCRGPLRRSIVPLQTAFDYAWDPSHYDGRSSMHRFFCTGLRGAKGASLAKALLKVAECAPFGLPLSPAASALVRNRLQDAAFVMELKHAAAMLQGEPEVSRLLGKRGKFWRVFDAFLDAHLLRMRLKAIELIPKAQRTAEQKQRVYKWGKQLAMLQEKVDAAIRSPMERQATRVLKESTGNSGKGGQGKGKGDGKKGGQSKGKSGAGKGNGGGGNRRDHSNGPQGKGKQSKGNGGQGKGKANQGKGNPGKAKGKGSQGRQKVHRGKQP